MYLRCVYWIFIRLSILFHRIKKGLPAKVEIAVKKKIKKGESLFPALHFFIAFFPTAFLRVRMRRIEPKWRSKSAEPAIAAGVKIWRINERQAHTPNRDRWSSEAWITLSEVRELFSTQHFFTFTFLEKFY